MMSHHILCHVGSTDTFTPSLHTGEATYRVTFRVPDSRDAIRSNVVETFRNRGVLPPPVVMDLLRLAMTAYAADMGVPRSSAYDAWTRDLSMHIPVQDPDLWSAALPILPEMLGFLTGDHWTIHCRALTATPPPDEAKPRDVPEADAVSLFSGGLDSFAGTIDRMREGQTLVLVGHHGMGTTNKAQERAHATIETAYPDRTVLLPFYVQGPPPLGNEPERTTRSRSFLFLSLGTATAAAVKPGMPLVVPENGLISLNPPLTDSRSGSLSTRTNPPAFHRLVP